MKIKNKLLPFVIGFFVTFSALFLINSPGQNKPVEEKNLETPAEAKTIGMSSINVPFIPNEGQVDDSVSYYTSLNNGTFYVSPEGQMAYQFTNGESGYLFGEALLTDKELSIQAQDKAETVVNVIRGNDSSKWRSNLPSYHELSFGDVYDGIGLTLKNEGATIEKIFTVQPQADPHSIQIQLTGNEKMDLKESGELVIADSNAVVSLSKPKAYQVFEGEKKPVHIAYRVEDNSTYGFELGEYDHGKPLIIDPITKFTFLGGSDSSLDEIDLIEPNTDDSDIFLFGHTQSSDFPTPGTPYDSTKNATGNYYEVFLAKMDSTLTTLKVATYYGGTGQENVYKAVVADDSVNNSTDYVYIAGRIDWSSDLPMHANAYDSTRYPSSGSSGTGFVAGFSNDLSTLIGSTYLDNASASYITVNSSDEVIVCGTARQWSGYSYVFPPLNTYTGYDQTLSGTNDGYCAIFDHLITTLQHVTLIGGSSTENIYNGGIDNDGYLWLGGYTGSTDFETSANAYDSTYKGNYIVKITASDLSAGAGSIPYGTFVGAISGLAYMNTVWDPDTPSKLYTYGYDQSNIFPTTSGAFQESRSFGYDAGLLKWNIEGDGSLTLDAGTYLGGFGSEFPAGLDVDSSGNIYFAGQTYSSTFPRVCPIRSGFGTSEAFITKFSSDLSTALRSTFIGGSSADYPGDIYIDGSDNIYLVGRTSSSDFPIVDAPGSAASAGYDGTYNTSEGFAVLMDEIDNADSDTDSDTWQDYCDNCPSDSNVDQADGDNDTVGDVCDNCPSTSNSSQTDTDSDTVGDSCDNCPSDSNVAQTDGDSDGIGDACDNCPAVYNPTQTDDDADGTGNVCDPDYLNPAEWVPTRLVSDYPTAATAYQQQPQAILTSDDNFIVAWVDAKSGTTKPYIEKINKADGLTFTGWTAGGIAVTDLSGTSPYYTTNQYALISDGAGGAYIAWDNGTSGDTNIYIQHFLSDGTSQYGTTGINVTTDSTGDERDPQLALDPSGDAFISWTNINGGTYTVRLNHIDATTGARSWVSDSAMTLTNAESSDLLADSLGNVFVTAYDRSNFTAEVEKFNSTGGHPSGWSSAIVLSETDLQGYPEMVTDGSDGVIIVYYWTDSGFTTEKLKAQRIFAAGSDEVGGPYDLNWLDGPSGGKTLRTGSSFSSIQPISDGSGGVYVAWGEANRGRTDIRANKISSAGTVSWGTDGIEVSDSADSANQILGAIKSADGNPLVVAFTDYSVSPAKVAIQRISDSGSLEWPEDAPSQDGRNFMSDDTTYDDYAPTVVADGTGGAAVFWQGYNGSFYADIYGQYHIHSPITSAPRASVSTSIPRCTIYPVRLDLPETLNVLQQDGRPVVELSWADQQSRDATSAEKVQVLFDYLDQEPAPELDGSKKPLEGVFTRQIYNQIYASGNTALIQAFEDGLKKVTSQEGDATLSLLSEDGINYNNDYFSDWWIYLLFEKLRTESPVAETFLSALKAPLDTQELSYKEVFRSLLTHFVNIQKSPTELEAAQCIDDAVAGMKLDDFVPRQGENIYEEMDQPLKDLLDKMKADGVLTSALAGIKKDEQFLTATQNSLDLGMNTLLLTWLSDAKVQELINYYRTNETMKEFRNLLFQTDVVQKMEGCLKDVYKRNLIKSVDLIRAGLVKKAIGQNEVCDENTSSIMLEVLQRMLANPEIKEDMEDMILNFINELLSLEQHLSDSTSYMDTFSQYFDEHYQLPSEDTYDDLTLEIFRDGQRIYSVDNPAFTTYVDENVPANTTGRTKTHKYFIRTSTVCETKQGSEGEAQVDPLLEPGDTVDVDADIKVNLKNGFNLLFIQKLEALIQAAKQNNQQLLTRAADQTAAPEGAQASEPGVLCEESLQALDAGSITGDKVMDYILNCHGNASINDELKTRRLKIVPPILLALKLNTDSNPVQVIDKLAEPVIQKLTEEINLRQEIFSRVGGQLARLDISGGISSFDEDEKKLIKCGGITDCSQEMKDLVTAYFRGSSHAATLSVEVYDENDEQVYQTDAESDIFGEVKGVPLGSLVAAKDYTIKIRPKDVRFVLPKLTKILLTSAEPETGGGFQAHLDLSYGKPFRFGNFDDSNDVIDRNDIITWSRLITENPELWDDSNLDGLYGVDLLDVITFQQNWGEIQESRLEEKQITLMQLAELFGLTTNLETRVQVPDWLNYLELTCTE